MKHMCMACGGGLGETLFLIPELPLVDSFCLTPAEAKSVPKFTIDLRQCETCKTIQVASPPDTSEIYRNYIYESSSSPDLLAHFSEYAGFVKKRVDSTDAKILEIGANDGLLLGKLREAGLSQLAAIDPSPQTAEISLPGVTIVNDFFNAESTSCFARSNFDVIIANNCFSHIPQLISVLSLCGELLAEDGMLMVEVQSTLDLIENVVFDYIYHEHYFYHSATSFDCIATMAGLELYEIKHVPTKGGSYRLLLGHPGAHKKDKSVDYWKYREEVAGIHQARPWLSMQIYLEGVKARLQELLSFGIDGRVFAYGASATGTVLLSYFGLDLKIDFIVDDNPKRQGLFAPGTEVQVLSPQVISPADLCIVTAWRHAAIIAPKMEAVGVPYIIPLPIPTTHG